MVMSDARRGLPVAAVIAVVLLVAGASLSCGSPETRSSSLSPTALAEPTAEAEPTPTIAPVAKAEPTPTAERAATATAEASPSAIDPTAIPTQTPPAHVPPPPDSITPRPTDVPVTPKPRPRLPVATDIKLNGSGKYYADVDSCHWAETVRLTDRGTGYEQVVMQTPCLPYEGLHYTPATGAVDYFVQ
jgi:hypothetical protein